MTEIWESFFDIIVCCFFTYGKINFFHIWLSKKTKFKDSIFYYRWLLHPLSANMESDETRNPPLGRSDRRVQIQRSVGFHGCRRIRKRLTIYSRYLTPWFTIFGKTSHFRKKKGQLWLAFTVQHFGATDNVKEKNPADKNGNTAISKC